MDETMKNEKAYEISNCASRRTNAFYGTGVRYTVSLRKCICITGFIIAILLLPAIAGAEMSKFLLLPADARGVGMGEAHVAATVDAMAMFWNPAALPLDGRTLTLSHREYIEGIRHEVFAGALSVGRGVVGLEGSLLNMPDLSMTIGGVETGESIKSYDGVFGVGYARRIMQSLYGGGVLKYVTTKLGDNTGQAVAADLGLLFVVKVPGMAEVPDGNNLRLGVMVANVGAKMKYGGTGYSLPILSSAGANYQPLSSLHVAMAVRYSPDSPLRFAMGGEWFPIRLAAVRAGFNMNQDRFLLTGGMGLRWGLGPLKMALDYALDPMGGVGLSHWVSLTVDLPTRDK